MMQGLHGKRIAHHLGIVQSTSLLLNPASGRSLALTRLRAPDGLAGPTKRVMSEQAHILTVHLQRPGLVKGWGNWTEGRFRPISFWDLGGIDIFDLRADPIVLRGSAFDTLHVYIPFKTLESYAEESGMGFVPMLHTEPGNKDEVILRWAKTLLPFFGDQYLLPTLVMDELVLMFCSYLARAYGTSERIEASSTGGLAFWQKSRASRMIHEHLNGELTLTDLASECGLSPSHFARAFKRSFGIPAHQYLIQQRVEMAKNLLLHSDLPLLSIALECGFGDQSAFNRSFRSLVGTSPGMWQRDQRSMPVRIVYSSNPLTSVPTTISW
jgi:AraC family transcriptional regulator